MNFENADVLKELANKINSDDSIKDFLQALLKSSPTKPQANTAWDFSEPGESQKPRGNGSTYDIHDVLYIPSVPTDISVRRSAEWKSRLQYWFSWFQERNIPINIWYSKFSDPLVFASHVLEVRSERVKIARLHKTGGQKDFRYECIYGLEVPSPTQLAEYSAKLKSLFGKKSDLKDLKTLFSKAKGPAKTKAVVINLPSSSNGQGDLYEYQLERYFNEQGFHVDLHGLKKTFEDEGVDLILVKNGRTYLAQAKAYLKKYLAPAAISEIANNMRDFATKHASNTSLIVGEVEDYYIVLPTTPDTEQVKAATENNIKLWTVDYVPNWSSVKCVYGSKNKKLYHCMSDSNYRKTNILTDKRRFWANSEEEAKAKGFTHAGESK